MTDTSPRPIHQEIRVGKFTLSYYYKDFRDSIHIEKDDGEGGGFKTKDFEKAIEAFYDANF